MLIIKKNLSDLTKLNLLFVKLNKAQFVISSTQQSLICCKWYVCIDAGFFNLEKKDSRESRYNFVRTFFIE